MSTMEIMKEKNLRILLSKLKISTYSDLSVNESRANLIINGYHAPVREMTKEDIAQKVSAMIALCAKLYCGMKDGIGTIPETIQECTRLVYKKFNSMGIHEIREAFLMASANEFEGVTLTAYYGTFTVAMLGDILSAYSKYRNKIISKFLYLKQNHEKQIVIEQQREQKNKEAREKIKIDIEAEIIAVQTGSKQLWENWNDVPAYYSKIAIDNNFIEISDEFKAKVWAKSKQIATSELIETSQDLSNFIEAKVAKNALMNLIESQTYKDSSVRIYSKLIIFEYVKAHKL